MKKLLSTLGAVIAATLVTTSAQAGWGGYTAHFATTNYLTAAAPSAIGWPTNTPGVGTGLGVNISQYDNVTLGVKGLLYSTNNTTGGIAVTVYYVTSATGGPGQPLNTQGTNAYQAGVTNCQFTDWSTVTNLSYTFTVTTGMTNCAINLFTNVPSTAMIGPAPIIGVASVTAAGLGTGGFITNLDCFVGGKAVVRPWSY